MSGIRIDISELAERVCQKKKVSINELCSGSRRKEILEARQVVSWIGVRKLGYSGADIARFLGVTTSCITRFLSKREQPDIQGIKWR